MTLRNVRITGTGVYPATAVMPPEAQERPRTGDTVEIRAPGTPVGQGSKTAASRNGRAWIRDSNAKTLHPWRTLVSLAASQAMDGRPLLTGPILLDVRFGFPRPRSHYRRDGSLRPLSPQFRDSTPDLDKLLRALGDALTGVVWVDDRMVVAVTATKEYADPPVTTVTVSRV